MKRGSALLIVLGMLSFMVVSAVGFSVYMRQGRLPSSYLRRNISSRYLVKAALANAIEELDCGFMSKFEIGEDEDDGDMKNGRMFGIYDNPYPGCGPSNQNELPKDCNRKIAKYGGSKDTYEYCDKDGYKDGDFWYKRVFCPFGLLNAPNPLDDDKLVDEPAVTVPTLTLEALAYLPTALIDDVRKVSRLTRTAIWRNLPYESGRYAYTAVNVSDLFDVNRLRASERRDSGLNRVTLATLTSGSSSDPTQVDQSRAEALDKIIDPDENSTLTAIDGKYVPFVSLADFALSALQVNKNFTPMLNYIGGASQSIFNGDQAEHANSMFITDTWFPSAGAVSSETNVVFSLAGEHQPFVNYDATSIPEVWQTALNAKTAKTTDGREISVAEALKKNLGLGVACLYDYLDGNSIPISLDFPTLEPVPMIVGIGAPTALKPTIDVKALAPVSDEVSRDGELYNVTRTITEYRLSSFGEVGGKFKVNFAAMFPFKRMLTTKRLEGASYKARAVARVYLMPKADVSVQKCRTDQDGVRPDDKVLFDKLGSKTYAKGIATFMSDSLVDLNFNDDMVKETDKKWIQDDTDTLKFTFDTEGIDIPVVRSVHEHWALAAPSENPPPVPPDQDVLTLDGFGVDKDQVWRPIAENRSLDVDWSGEVSRDKAVEHANTVPFESIVKFTPAAGAYSLHVSVWIQVVDAANNNQVVDMVPACADDDDLWLNADDGPHVGKAVSRDYPVLDFVSDYEVDFSDPTKLATAFGSAAVFSEWNALFAVDPRFNAAPEDWFCSKGGNTNLKDAWCKAMGAGGETGGKVFGAQGTDQNGRQFTRDRDVFMFVSNQEYLQSITELQFLPWLGDMSDSKSYANLGKRNLPADPEYSPAFHYDGNQDGNKSFVNRRLDEMGGKVDLTGNKFANESYFWRTYTVYNNSNDSELEPWKCTYPLQSLPIDGGKMWASFVSGGGGFRVNPFSDDIRVQAAAIVNTPFDYYVASTNNNQQQANAKKNLLIDDIDLSNMGQYSFGPNCTAAQVSKADIDNIIDEISDAFHDMASKGETDWQSVWDYELLWQENKPEKTGDNNQSFLSESLALSLPLHGVDRKYLSSFWRECYGNCQQLFLIFVRAEPASVGGGASGNVSSAQLGGRAVALVWRDPAPPTGTGGSRTARRSTVLSREDFRQDYKQSHSPHRTRVLFYHQFD